MSNTTLDQQPAQGGARPRASKAAVNATKKRRQLLHPPRATPIGANEVVWFLGINVVIIAALWARHNGTDPFSTPGGTITAIGQLSGLFGAFAILMQLVLVARTPWLDRLFGMDRLIQWHRWNGFAAVWLLITHAFTVTIGYAMGDRKGYIDEFLVLVRTYPDVLMSVAGLALFITVAATSVKVARRKLAYESWFFVHLYSYLALALSFAHQLAVGFDLSSDKLARTYWVSLYIATIATIVSFRVIAPLANNYRHHFHVIAVQPEGPGVVSIYIDGEGLERYRAESGQYVNVRFLTRSDWYKAHPFSFSAAPATRFLRITVKNLGDHSGRLQKLQVGTPVFLEGPYGRFTNAARTRKRALLIAGGVGITPLRAMYESMPGKPGDIAMLYRASNTDDLVFRQELDSIAQARGFGMHYAVGSRRKLAGADDPFRPTNLLTIAPDLRDRDIFLCGPTSMVHAALNGLQKAGVPKSQIHHENFSY